MQAAWLSSDTFILTCQLNDVGAQGSVSFVKQWYIRVLFVFLLRFRPELVIRVKAAWLQKNETWSYVSLLIV
jgi:hypothetical protein